MSNLTSYNMIALKYIITFCNLTYITRSVFTLRIIFIVYLICSFNNNFLNRKLKLAFYLKTFFVQRLESHIVSVKYVCQIYRDLCFHYGI